MTAVLSTARTALRLGPANVLRVAAYRALSNRGWHPACRLSAVPPQGPFFSPVQDQAVARDTGPQTALLLFGWASLDTHSEVPDWSRNVLTGNQSPVSRAQWWKIPDFDPAVGDIKGVWEPSRMDWAVVFAARAKRGEVGAIENLNTWLASWLAANPPYLGRNWKCGQEASLRLLHLAVAAMLVDQVQDALPGLRDLIWIHLQRIAPTMGYARAQDNNHGTSEAVALYVGGTWLVALGDDRGRKLAALGRKALEERVLRLVAHDGAFSQYSTNYHRLFLDTVGLAEVWRRRLGLPAFSQPVRQRMQMASRWLRAMVDAANGDVPNLGANDGAMFFQLGDMDVRDFRSSAQLAACLFEGGLAFSSDAANLVLVHALDVELPNQVLEPPPQLSDESGSVVAQQRGSAKVVVRMPRFQFRPSQADALHVDLWVRGVNVLRDAGTYSYAADTWLEYFAGARGHNTVQFDDHDQMPRLSRFLFSDWLKPTRAALVDTDEVASRISAGYTDRWGASHERAVAFDNAKAIITDDVAGFDQMAVLRWRLAPDTYDLTRDEHGVSVQAQGRAFDIHVSAAMGIRSANLVTGWESRHYGVKTEVPVLEVAVGQPGRLVSEVRWA